LVERARGAALPSEVDEPLAARRALLGMGVGFVIITLALVPAEIHHRAKKRSATEAAASESMKTASAASTSAATPTAANHELTGRYRSGPEKAAYRIVMFTDFQCVDCKRVEAEVLAVMAKRTDISFSVKHFPMCTHCNENMGGRNLHPNACWAARASEAAGILKGDAGFFAMCRWLFERSGSFTDTDIKTALPALGFDTAAFLATMHSESTEWLVKQDIEEAINLGVRYTPHMFINGVVFRGWEVPGVVKAVLTELDGNTPSLTPDSDQPIPARAK
jgi:protein-disulfide isomerase